MFILVDPKRCRDELIESFETCLMQRSHNYFVVWGMGDLTSNSIILSREEAKEITRSFCESDVARIGARHGIPLGYHFSVSIDKHKNDATLLMYISEWNDKGDIEHQLKAITELLSYQYGINKLNVPFFIEVNSDDTFVFKTEDITNITTVIKVHTSK